MSFKAVICDSAVIAESDDEVSILVPFSSHFSRDPKTLSPGSSLLPPENFRDTKKIYDLY